MDKRGEGGSDLKNLLIVIAIVIVLLFGIPTKLYAGTKMALAWIGVVSPYEILDQEYISIIDVKENGEVYSYDPNDWRGGDGSIDCDDGVGYVKIIFDRNIDETSIPGSFKLYKERGSCCGGTDKKNDYSQLSVNYELDNKGLGTELKIGPVQCSGCGICIFSEWNFLVHFEYHTVDSILQGKIKTEDGKTLNQGTGLVKFNAG